MLSTATKIFIAGRIASFLFALGIKPRRRVMRRGVTFELDLEEGIDLSLFLFGGFQADVLHAIQRYAVDATSIIDVGANIGAMTLPLAATLPATRVVAIEPTNYAFAKLTANIALNPSLQNRITALKTFIADRTDASSELVAYSSWRVDSSDPDAHPVHRGSAMQAECGQVTIDDLVRKQNLGHVSAIKIDTDGHEFAVLSGAHHTLTRSRPAVIFEACEYLMRPPRPTFEDFERFFRDHRYSIRKIATGKAMSAEGFRKTCPQGGGMDLLALPDERL